jgi:hypothetical protein
MIRLIEHGLYVPQDFVLFVREDFESVSDRHHFRYSSHRRQADLDMFAGRVV